MAIAALVVGLTRAAANLAGGPASVAAAYTGILAAIGFYRVLMEVQVREVDAKRRRSGPG